MSSILQCNDMKDAVLLFQSTNLQLYLKPIASLWISIQLPGGLEKSGKSVSTLEIMEKIKTSARPYEIISMKVLKSMLEYVRFEAHLESRHQIPSVLERLDRSTVKLNNFPESLKVRVCESKITYPSRHDWDTFFHENKNMNQLKPGERPDTVHFSMLPCSWFMSSAPSNGLLDPGSTKLKPSETVVRAVFEVFGPLRTIDIPMLDPYRSKIVPSLNTFAFGQDGFFDVYIQFHEYVGFVKCMAAFKGMKLLKKDCNNIWTAVVQVDFDRTRHLSEHAIKDRRLARERIIQEEIDKERADKLHRELEQEEKRRRMLEEATLQQKKLEEEARIKKQIEEDAKVAIEERKLVLVQRRLESLRLLEAILERVKDQVEEKVKEKQTLPKEKEKSNKTKEIKRKQKLEEKERALRSRLLKKYHQVGEQLLEEQRERVRQTVQASALKLKSAVNVVPESPILLSGAKAFVVMSQSPYSEKRSKEDGKINSSLASGNRSLQSPQTRRSQIVDHIIERNSQGSHHRIFHQQRSTSFNEKRYPPSKSFQPYRRGRGRRGQLEGPARPRQSNLDQELWDGPEADIHQHSASSSRSGYKREQFIGNVRGEYYHSHDHRTRGHYHNRNKLLS